MHNSKVVQLLFGGETPGFVAFFRIALLRLALAYPLCAVFSNSATDVCELLLIVFWLLGGNWRGKYEIVKNSPILLVSTLFMIISFVGVFQYEESFWASLKYWRGHHPIPILIILATTLTSNRNRILMFNSLSFALFAAIAYSICVMKIPGFEFLKSLKPAHIAKNSIWFGMSLVLLGGLWICVPFLSRLNPYFRPFLPASTRRSLRCAARLSLYDYLQSFYRNAPQVHFFVLLRFSAVFFSTFYIFGMNPSRTAWISSLAGTTLLLLLWDWKKGTLIALLLATCLISFAMFFSPIFQYKARLTNSEISQFVETNLLGEGEEKPAAHARLRLYWYFAEDIAKNPFGVGMEKTRSRCLYFSHGKLDNCHSEFVSIAMQSGWHGLACFLVWFFFLFRGSWQLASPWKQLGLYISMTLFLACMFNGALSQDMESHTYCIAIAVIVSLRNADARSQAPVQRVTGQTDSTRIL